MQYESSRQISYRLNLQTSADLKVGASKGQRGRVRVEGLDSGLETKGWRRLNLCTISEHRCNTFVVNLCGCRLTAMFENYFKHGYIFRADRDLLLWLHWWGWPCPSKARLFSLCILQKASLQSRSSNRPFFCRSINSFPQLCTSYNCFQTLLWEMRVADIHCWPQVIFVVQTLLWGPFNAVFQLSAFKLFV